ncbi:MAG TPA: tetratricopeptide repeat protein, partial [Bryobacteraceae bacterium]|nr:tetratricopeptide repeat protein [Bryobacteraceae bacterium]
MALYWGQRIVFHRLIVLFLLLAAVAAAGWVRLESPHFELLTNAGEATGRTLLDRLEEIHGVFRSLPGNRPSPPVPTRVLLFRSESDFRPFRLSETTTGYFQAGPERNYIVMRDSGRGNSRIACHEYVHLVLNHSSARLPQWLEEGVAEFYSTLDRDGDRLTVGRPIPEHVRTLSKGGLLGADALASITQKSPHYNDPTKTHIFYAQSWALVHMLNLSPEYRDKMADFVSLIEEGVPSRAAFERAFGKPLQQALQDLEAWLRQGIGTVAVTGIDAPVSVENFALRDLSEGDANLAQAELLVQIGRTETAERIYRRIEREDPRSPDAQTGLGALALERSRYKVAREHLLRAMELGANDARTHFEYAMLLRETGASSDEVMASLKKAITAAPSFAEAHFVLGMMLSATEDYAEAANHLARAASILPRQAYFWHALALAYQHLGQLEEARRAAYRAAQAAVTEQEIEMARAAIRLADQPAAADKTRRPPVSTPDSWKEKRGDTRIEGTLRQIDCLG